MWLAPAYWTEILPVLLHISIIASTFFQLGKYLGSDILAYILTFLAYVFTSYPNDERSTDNLRYNYFSINNP
jgi:hypothetical protein